MSSRQGLQRTSSLSGPIGRAPSSTHSPQSRESGTLSSAGGGQESRRGAFADFGVWEAVGGAGILAVLCIAAVYIRRYFRGKSESDSGSTGSVEDSTTASQLQTRGHRGSVTASTSTSPSTTATSSAQSTGLGTSLLSTSLQPTVDSPVLDALPDSFPLPPRPIYSPAGTDGGTGDSSAAPQQPTSLAATAPATASTLLTLPHPSNSPSTLSSLASLIRMERERVISDAMFLPSLEDLLFLFEQCLEQRTKARSTLSTSSVAAVGGATETGSESNPVTQQQQQEYSSSSSSSSSSYLDMADSTPLDAVPKREFGLFVFHSSAGAYLDDGSLSASQQYPGLSRGVLAAVITLDTDVVTVPYYTRQSLSHAYAASVRRVEAEIEACDRVIEVVLPIWIHNAATSADVEQEAKDEADIRTTPSPPSSSSPLSSSSSSYTSSSPSSSPSPSSSAASLRPPTSVRHACLRAIFNDPKLSPILGSLSPSRRPSLGLSSPARPLLRTLCVLLALPDEAFDEALRLMTQQQKQQQGEASATSAATSAAAENTSTMLSSSVDFQEESKDASPQLVRTTNNNDEISSSSSKNNSSGSISNSSTVMSVLVSAQVDRLKMRTVSEWISLGQRTLSDHQVASIELAGRYHFLDQASLEQEVPLTDAEKEDDLIASYLDIPEVATYLTSASPVLSSTSSTLSASSISSTSSTLSGTSPATSPLLMAESSVPTVSSSSSSTFSSSSPLNSPRTSAHITTVQQQQQQQQHRRVKVPARLLLGFQAIVAALLQPIIDRRMSDNDNDSSRKASSQLPQMPSLVSLEEAFDSACMAYVKRDILMNQDKGQEDEA